MKKTRSSGFTLIELLVVISIIAILASLAIPAVTGALTKGQMMQTVSNGRQVHLASMNLSTEQNSTGDSSIIAWPGDTNVVTAWYSTNGLTGVLSTNDLKKLFSAPGQIVTDWTPAAGPTDAKKMAFYVYNVTENSDSSMIFLSTRNWEAPTGVGTAGPALEANAAPYGEKGFVVVYRGGNANTYNKRQAINKLDFFGSSTNALNK